MGRLSWVAAAVTIALACWLGVGAAAASPTSAGRTASATSAAKHKKKRPSKRAACKPGQAQLHVGRRTICVTHSLKVAHTTPQAALLATALHLGIGATRDRRGRHTRSLATLLGRTGPHAQANLERAISIGLVKDAKLALAGARGARAAALPRAAAADACESDLVEQANKELAEASPSEREAAQKEIGELESKKSIKSGDAEVSLGIERGALELGIDIKAKGVSVQVHIRSCGEGALKLDACPTAAGKVEGHGHAELQAAFKVSEGATVVMSQSFKFGGETTVKAQTGDDGKLDYYDIKHLYSLVGSFGGTKAKFGPITVDTTYIGEAHVDMRSGGGALPPAEVDVMMSMAGVDPAERIAAEIKLAREAQAQADKEFAAEVEKATKQLRDQERSWLTPNTCASVQFEPISESLKLHKGQTGSFKSRTEAKGGGAPASASWTLSAQQNATVTPSGSEGNPLTSSYSVTEAGAGKLVSATLKATSKAGVAEGTWKQKTESVIQVMTGSFSGRDEREGEVLEWSGTATFARIPESADGTSVLEPTSSELTVTVSGTAPTGCTVTGKERVPIFERSAISVLGEGAPGVGYDIDVPFGFPDTMSVTFGPCPPKVTGGPGTISLPNEALLTGDALTGGPSALVKTSPDGVTYAGSAKAAEPEASLSWSWSFTGST